MKPTIIQGDCMDVLPTLEAGIANCCVTSPPYWGLRDYGIPGRAWGGDSGCQHEWEDASWRPSRWGKHDDDKPGDKQQTNSGSLGHRGDLKQQSTCGKCGAWFGVLGLEPTPEQFVEHMVQVFREVRRVLRDDGTLWINLGDSYASAWPAPNTRRNIIGQPMNGGKRSADRPSKLDLKEKDLVGIPWMVAFALRADGWYLRSDIIWHKPNPMPESVTDRCTKAHEYIFMLSKSERYYWNQHAILEPVSENTHARLSQDVEKQVGSARANGGAKTNGNMKAVGRKLAAAGSGTKNNESFNAACCLTVSERNKRSVWTVTTQPYKGAHFATFPKELIRPCILAGCPAGGTVLEPFLGSGTTAEVARKNGCHCVGIELNPDYHKLINKRLKQNVLPMGEAS
jgi:DNA modification methylase